MNFISNKNEHDKRHNHNEHGSGDNGHSHQEHHKYMNSHYRGFAIPLAAGAFLWGGLIISPAAGAAVMSLSNINVAVNAKLLKFD